MPVIQSNLIFNKFGLYISSVKGIIKGGVIWKVNSIVEPLWFLFKGIKE